MVSMVHATPTIRIAILNQYAVSPSLLFIIFESIINFAMIIEVTIRGLALQRVIFVQGIMQ